MKLILTMFLALLAGPSFGAATDFVPSEIWQKITNLNAMKAFFSENLSESICFTSAESSYGLGTVTNCIVEIPDGKNSLWMMKQNIETSDRRIKNLIATYIDISSSSTPKAYFLELDREQFESSGGLVAIPYKVPCVICHSSGPRVIRPTTASLGSLNSKQVELLTQWNEKIASYKVVETFKPKSKFAKLLEPQKKVFKERLRLSKCTGCHNEEAGVRASLTRMHSGTIGYLSLASQIDFGQAQMPGYQSFPLTSSEKQCLASWVEGGEPEGCAEETPFGPKSSDESIPNVIENRSEEMGRVIDANASTVAVKVATTFHDFTINNISVTGVVSRLAGSDKRAFKIQLGLDSLNAGINARTVHAKKWLDITNFPSIEVEGVFSMNRPSPSVDVARPAVKVRGITRVVRVTLECHSEQKTCDLQPININLTDWGLSMPGFLGIEVDPVVEVSGRIALKQ